MRTSRGSLGEVIHLPVGECLTRILGRKNVEKTELSISAPGSRGHSFKLFRPGLKNVYPLHRIGLFRSANTRFVHANLCFVKLETIH